MAKLWASRSSYTALRVTVLCLLTLAAFGSPAIASPDEVKWSPVNIPTEGKAGNWVLAAGSDVQHLTMAVDGALYAGVPGLTYTLYKSTNAGYGWSYIGNVTDNVVAVATSPHDANLVYYATTSGVYRSGDSGKTFKPLPANPGGAGSNNLEITTIAVTWLSSNIIAVGTRDTDGSQFGGVYILDEEEVIPGWIDTNLSGFDVYAVAFPPDFTADRQLVAVVTDETDTYVTTKIGDAGWGATTGDARLDKDNSVPPTPVAVAVSADIAFPGDYDSDISSGNYVQFVTIDTGADNGDAYKVKGVAAPGQSVATDLNISAAYGLQNIDLTSLAVSGNAASARLLAGAAGAAQTYFSTDGGLNWTRSSKEPTGESKTYVLMAPDSGGKAYAATSGNESALSVSHDEGATWNQAALIDTAISTVIDLAPSPNYSRDNTLFMLTFGGKHSLWRSASGGTSWERIFSSALANVDDIDLVKLSPRYGSGSQVVFLAGSSNSRPAIWRSSNDGQRFSCRLAFDSTSGAPLPIDAWAVVDDTSLLIGSYDGSNGLVYYTTNSGFFYAAGVSAGSQSLNSVALSPSYEKDKTVLIGNTDGWVYWSDDSGTSFQSLPPNATSPPLTGAVTVAFDSEFDSNKTVYAATSTANEGVYRFIIGKSTGWEGIDSTLPAGGMLSRLMVSTDGVLYAANSKAGGGMERCLNPTYPLGPVFETVTRGLDSDAALSGLWQDGHRLWSIDTANTRLMTLTDTLTSSAAPASPPDGASGTGSLSNHTISNITLDWGALKEATSYQWQLSYSTDFSAVPSQFGGTADASSAHLPALEPGTTYYWRVRATAPVLSPWSAKWSFSTSLDTDVLLLRLESPQIGASGAPVKPLFQWSAIAGASAYELLVSADSHFADPSITRIGDHALPTTAWQSDLSLKYGTTYFWKVRAVSSNTASAWSTVGTFTTEPAPTAAPSVPVSSAPPVTPAPSPAPRPWPTSLAPIPLASPVPAPLPPPQPVPLVPPSPVPATPDWIVYLIGALLLIIILLLIITLVLVVTARRL